jgi:hypothetical protein
VEGRVDLPTKLRQAQGFVVETATGPFGTVERLRVDDRSGMPDAIVVRTGLLGRRRMVISVADVSQVLPRQRRIRLRSRWMTIEA